MKYMITPPYTLHIPSLPLWERGLKYSPALLRAARTLSLPLWERGLKFPHQQYVAVSVVSLPLWERGLKSYSLIFTNISCCVAPLVGAWIEMIALKTITFFLMSLPLWERGLKSAGNWTGFWGARSLPLWERGLKSHDLYAAHDKMGRSPCGSVD